MLPAFSTWVWRGPPRRPERPVQPRCARRSRVRQYAATSGSIEENVSKLAADASAAVGLRLSRVDWDPARARLQVFVAESAEPATESVLNDDLDIDKCAEISRKISYVLDDPEGSWTSVFPASGYDLQVSSEGLGDAIRSDKDFVAFRGFEVLVKTTEEWKRKTEFEGRLVERTTDHVVIGVKGRMVRIPCGLVQSVSMASPMFEEDDPYC